MIQISIIAVMSIAASWAFMYTKTAIQLNGLCFYRYVVYAAAAFLGCWCFSRYKRYAAIAFSSAMILMAFSPLGKELVELFPLAIPFLTTSMGVITTLAVPKSRGREFFALIVMLILPALLAESKIGGSSGLVATTSSVGYYELSLVTIIVVGGYFYLRYAALANLNKAELLLNGAAPQDVGEASRLGSIITARALLGACGAAGLLMIAVPAVTDALRGTSVNSPVSVLTLELIAGMVTAVMLYLLKSYRKEQSKRP